MFIEEKPTHCSKCDSTKYETFFKYDVHQGGFSGIRCLNCGHERIKPVIPRQSSESWSMKEDSKQTF